MPARASYDTMGYATPATLRTCFVTEARCDPRSTLVTCQFPVDNPTLACTILDRPVHHTYNLTLIRRIDAKTTCHIDKGTSSI